MEEEENAIDDLLPGICAAAFDSDLVLCNAAVEKKKTEKSISSFLLAQISKRQKVLTNSTSSSIQIQTIWIPNRFIPA